MFRVQQAPAGPPPLNTRFAIVNSIYNNPFHCLWGFHRRCGKWSDWVDDVEIINSDVCALKSVFKGLIGFVAGVVIARTVSEEWASSL